MSIGDMHIGFGADPTLAAARDRIAALEADLARVTAALVPLLAYCEGDTEHTPTPYERELAAAVREAMETPCLLTKV